jgi:1,4-alpha-glucan branching enzyme
MQLTKHDWTLFTQGNHYEIYKKLGAHFEMHEGRKGVFFSVWAPKAQSVSVIGDFNEWNPSASVMYRIAETGFWEIFVPNVWPGQLYKFYIVTKRGEVLYKADPFCVAAEKRPGTASRIGEDREYFWEDTDWMRRRAQTNPKYLPMFIYELHIGSWMRHLGYKEGNPEGFYNYRELARSLADYVKDMGYTHVELIGVAEHQNDYSWGYQISNPFAVNARHGSPKDFKYFVDYLHQNQIGVILDWVPAHFAKDAQGLSRFDGSSLYEYADPKLGNHPIWGTRVYDYGKGEVRSYLIANELYWLKEYHLDGIRVDAVDSMIHLSFGRKKGDWIPNCNGTEENLEALELIRKLTKAVEDLHNGAFTVAEDSSAYPNICGNRKEGGLGFTFKWNMGWEYDFQYYIQKKPEERTQFHDKATFSMVYAYDENFILVLSHDNFGHGKPSMIRKFPGNKKERMAQLKTMYVFMMGHPGKKLLFMGQDFAQQKSWSISHELDWKILTNRSHAGMKNFMKRLIEIYKQYPCLYDSDYDRNGFSWINANDRERSVFSFERHSKNQKQHIIFVCNFKPDTYHEYRIGVPKDAVYQLILNSGKSKNGREIYVAEPIGCDGRECSICVDIEGYSAMILLRVVE